MLFNLHYWFAISRLELISELDSRTWSPSTKTIAETDGLDMSIVWKVGESPRTCSTESWFKAREHMDLHTFVSEMSAK